MPLTGYVLAGLLTASSMAVVPSSLSGLQGQNVVAVIFAPGADDPRFSQQTSELYHLTAQPPFQSLMVVGVAGDTVMGVTDAPGALRARFGVPPTAFRFLLVGKDGRIALNQGSVVTQDRIAQAIEAMPTR
ncbi:MAG TPA: DUF4174 domain-containing protein [Caulobacteraceae bacterium]|jgi:hypothetical protein